MTDVKCGFMVNSDPLFLFLYLFVNWDFDDKLYQR